MRELNLEQGGRPLTNDDLKDLQDNLKRGSEAWLRGLQIGAVVLEGCTLTLVSGNTYNLSSGIVFIDGRIKEVQAVSGISLSTPQYIVSNQPQEVDLLLHEDGEILPTVIEFTTSIVGSVPATGEYITLAHLSTPATLRQALDNISVPVGFIGMVDDLSGFNLSTGLGNGAWLGWAWCDGRNGTIDMRGFFPVGFDNRTTSLPTHTDISYNTLGASGGAKNVQLTIGQIPSHDHKVVVDGNGNETNLGASNSIAESGQVGSNTNFEYTLAGIANNPTLGKTSPVGGGGFHENRPPWKVLAFVKKIS